MLAARQHIPCLHLVDACVNLATSRNAWCVGDEFLIVDIVNADKELAHAKSDLDRAQDLGHDLDSARLMRRIVRASKAKAADLRYSADGAGTRRGNELLEEANHLVRHELERTFDRGGNEATALLLICLGELNNRHRDGSSRYEALTSTLGALEIARSLGDRILEADALLLAAQCLLETEAERAMGYADSAVPIFHALGDKLGEGKAKHFVGVCRFHTTLRVKGIQALEQALKLFREAEEVSAVEAPRCLALELFTLADLYPDLRRFRRALKVGSEAADLFTRQAYGRGWPANVKRLQVEAFMLLEQGGQSQQLAIDAVEEYREQGNIKAAADVLMGLIHSLVHERRYEAALQYAEELLDSTRNFDDPDWEANALLTLARVHQLKLEYDQAFPLMEEVRWLAQKENDDIKEWVAIERTIRMLHETSQYDQAVALLQEHRELSQRMGDKMREGWVLLRACLVWGGKDDPMSRDNVMAMEAAVEAQAIFAKLGDRGWEASAWDKISQSHIIFFDDEPMKPEEALAAAKKGRALHQKKGDKEREAKMLQRVFCRIYKEWGRHGESTKHAEEAVSIARGLQDKIVLAEVLSQCVRLRMEQVLGEIGQEGPPVLSGKEADRCRRKAVKEAKEAYACAREVEDKYMTGLFAWLLGQTKLKLEGLHESALELSKTAAAIAVECHDVMLEAQVALLEAEAHIVAGDQKGAAEAAALALTLSSGSGDAETQALAQEFMMQLENNFEPGAGKENCMLPVQQDRASRPRAKGKMGRLMAGGEQELKSGKRGSRVDKESLMKVVAETAMSDVGLGNIDYDTALFDSGVDSLSGVALRNRIQTLTGMGLPANMIYDFPTQRAIVSYLTERSNVEYTDA